LDDENDEAKKLRFIREQESKQAFEKRVRDNELGIIKESIDAYYTEVKELLMTSDVELDKQDDKFKKWHHSTADWLLTSKQTASKLDSSLHDSLKKTGQENKEPNKQQKSAEEIAKELASM
jgi:hypothetical protein